jgi:hypothetical protein
MTRLAIRLYLAGQLEEEIVCDAETTDLKALAERHAARACNSGKPHLVEIEFLDEPDENQRYYRFGSDPSYMVRPLKVKL